MNELYLSKNIQNPIQLFNSWLKQASQYPEIKQANAMVLSNFNPESSQSKLCVSSRVVLLKQVQEKLEQLIFYTNYNSVKKSHLLNYPSALNFYWPPLDKQIRLEGHIKKTNREQSIQYWKSRSEESKLSQYISPQSTPLKNLDILKIKWKQVKKNFSGKEIPCPLHWGGYIFTPNLIEFWIEKPHRLHERLQFIKSSPKQNKWSSCFLAP